MRHAIAGDTPAPHFPDGLGLGGMLALLSGEMGKQLAEAPQELARQLAEGKDQTWREQKDREFGLYSDGDPFTTP